MPKCSYCSKHFDNFKYLITHLKLIHNCSENQKYKCVENNCFRNFSNLNSFRKHLRTHEIIKVPSCSSNEASENVFVKNHHETSINHEDSKGCNIHNQIQHETLDLDSNYDEFQKLLDTLKTTYYCRLYGNTTFNRKDVQNVIDSTKYLYEEPLQLIHRSILHFADKYNFDSGHVETISLMFNSVLNIFQDTNSDYRRLKCLEKSKFYINPLEIIIAENIQANKEMNEAIKHVAHLVPISEVLKNFFQLPDILQKTLSYMKDLSSSFSKDKLIHFFQTPFWQNKVKKFPLGKGEYILPIVFYYDDYEVGNPLGSHATVHKLGAIYYFLPTIPPAYRASLRNIFIALLFHTNDLKSYGANKVLSRLIAEIQNLENEGIEINEAGKKTKLYFAMPFILGDNLGIHTMLGFTESFSATYCCRFCKCCKTEMKYLTKEKMSVLRTEQNYREDLETDNMSATGIKSPSVWSNIRSFSVTENLVVDILHDLFEGVVLFDVILLLHQFIFVDNYFTVDVLNCEIQSCKFGENLSNKPNLFSNEHIKKKSLKMSASECRTFVLYAGLLIGHYIPENNKYWSLFIVLRKILSIILSKTISESDCRLLKTYVSQHHEQYIKLFGENLKPKHHHLIHYPRILQTVGPVDFLSSFRFESKHRQSKLAANVVSSRKNITKTLTIKHQLQLADIFLTGLGFDDNIEYSENFSYSNILDELPQFPNYGRPDIMKKFSKTVILNKVTFCNTKYKINQVIQVTGNPKPQFIMIQKILVNDSKEICFISIELETSFHEHFSSFRVRETRNIKCLLHSELVFYKPITIFDHSDGNKYITVF